MKRSDVILKIDDLIRRNADGETILSFLESLGMRPPEREEFLEIKPDDEHVYKTNYGCPAIDLDSDPIYRKVKVSGWEAE